MPHFWALAMRFRDDYARAGVPMLPVVAPALSVGRQTVVWAWLTVAVSLLLWPVGSAVRHRLALHGGCGALWAPGSSSRRTGCSAASAARPTTKPMKLFHVSISYLALLSVAIIVDVLI